MSQTTATPETLSTLKRALYEAWLTGPGPASVPLVTTGPHYPLSPAQARIHFLDQAMAPVAIHTRPVLLELQGPLELGRLQHALAAVVDRHNPIRCCIRWHHGGPTARPVDRVMPRLTRRNPPDGLWWRESEAMTDVQRRSGLALRLESEPPLHLFLYPLEARRHWLLLLTHDIAFDGLSESILTRALAEGYRCGHSTEIDSRAPRYRDYALQQHRKKIDGAFAADVHYWIERLRDLPDGGQITPDFTPSGQPSYAAGTFRRRLPADLVQSLQVLARGSGATLYMILLAAFKVLLHRFGGRSDLVVGAPTSGRSLPGTENLIGRFVNIVCVRTVVSGEVRFIDYLSAVKTAVLEALTHAAAPFENIVNATCSKRDPRDPPVFRTIFELIDEDTLTQSPDGDLTVDTVAVDKRFSYFDMSVELKRRRRHWECAWIYRTELFRGETVEQLHSCYEFLLREILRDPEIAIRNLTLSDTTPGAAPLAWDDGPATGELERHLLVRFAWQVRNQPDQVAVRSGEENLTYASLAQVCHGFAQSLRAQGVEVEDRVAILVEASVYSVIAPLATMMAGAAYVPLDVTWPASRIEMILDDIQPSVVITDRDEFPCAAERWRVHRISDASESLPDAEPLPEPALDRLAYVIYTTGSTGRPKGVMVEHDQLANYVAAFQERVGFGRSQSISLIQTLAVDSSVGVIFVALASGACVDVTPQAAMENPESLVEYLGSREFQVLKAAPSHLSVLLGIDPHGHWLPSRALISGGETLPVDLARSIDRCGRGCTLFNHYGPTEATVGATVHEIVSGGLDQRQQFVPIGRPLDNVRICVVDCYMNILPRSAVGELLIEGRCVARGYWDRPAETAESFIQHPIGKGSSRLYRSGDLVRMRLDGALEFVGRRDDEMNIRGWRVHPAELSAGLKRSPRIADAFVMQSGKPRRLTAYVVPADHGERAGKTTDTAMLRREASDWLPNSLLPDHWVVLDELPRTGHGKIDRKVLARYQPTVAADAQVPPRTPTEAVVAEVWRELLGRSDIGVHDDFFTLGGHSLLVIELTVRLSEVLGAAASVSSVFEAPTVAGIARIIDSDAPDIPDRIEPVKDRHGNYPLTTSQLRLWLLSRIKRQNAHLITSRVFRTRDTLDIGALHKAMEAVTARHEDLRTVFDIVDDRPVQRVLPSMQPVWEEVDLTRLDESEQRARLDRVWREARNRPFNMATGPLSRLLIVYTGRDTAQMMFVTHHLISDGWSKTIFFRELDVFYRAFAAGKTHSLPPLRVQLIDFALWQKTRLEHPAIERQRAYWLRKLERPPHLDLMLESDGSDPEECGHMMHDLDGMLCDKIENAVRGTPATVYMFMLTALKILLSRWSGQEDIVVGTPVANRYLPEIEPVMGFFVNQLALRTKVPAAETVRQILLRVRETCLGAFAHAELSFESVLQATNPERGADVMPLFRIYFNMHVFDEAHHHLPAFEVDQETSGINSSHFDLSLYVRRRRHGLCLSVLYRKNAFSGPQVRELIDQYSGILNQMCMGNNTPVYGLRLVTDRARALLPHSGEPLPLDWGGPVHTRFDQQAIATPHAVAVEHAGLMLTYQQLRFTSNRLAHRLLGMGIGRGHTVAVLAGRDINLVAAMIGILKSGAALTLLDPAYPRARLISQIETANAELVLRFDCSDRFCKQAPTLNPGDGDGPDHDPDTRIEPDDLAIVSFTSGSTGNAKAVLGRHRSLTEFTEWTAAEFGLSDSDRYSLLSGLSHDPLQREIFTPLQLGARICVPDETVRTDPRKLFDWLRCSAISVLHLTPAMGQLIALGDNGTQHLPSARAFFFVGEPLSWRLVTRLHDVAPDACIVNYYGTTETQRAVGYYVAFDPSAGAINRGALVQDTVPIGRGIPGVQLLVLTRDGQLAGAGEIGEIHVRSRCLAAGYLGDPAHTAARFIPNPRTGDPGDVLYRTGDLGRYATDGTVVFFGRNDGQVKIRGHRVEPGEVEAVISDHPVVKDAVVVCKVAANENGLHAYFVSDGEIPFHEIREFTADRLAPHCVPLTFTRVKSIPLTPNGKVDAAALPESSRPLDLNQRPVTALEITIARLFARALELDGVNLDDRFFDIGGSSLSAVLLQSMVERETGRTLPMEVMYRGQSVRSVVNHLNRGGVDVHRCLLPLAGGSGNSLFMVPGAASGVHSLGLLARALSSTYRVFGLQPLGLDDDRPAHDMIARMAEFYIDAIERENIPQPYFVAGRCFGAIVAFEMALQMSARGRKPGKLIVIDNVTPPDTGVLGVKSVRHSRPAKAVHKSLQSRLRDEIQRTIESVPEPLRERYRVVRDAHRKALRSYRPRHYDGDIVVIGAREEHYPLQADWASLTSGRALFRSVPGNHESMFSRPAVDRLAAVIDEYLS